MVTISSSRRENKRNSPDLRPENSPWLISIRACGDVKMDRCLSLSLSPLLRAANANSKCATEGKSDRGDLLSSLWREYLRKRRARVCRTDVTTFLLRTLSIQLCPSAALFPRPEPTFLPFPLLLPPLPARCRCPPSQLAGMMAPFSANCSAPPAMLASLPVSPVSSSCGWHERQNKLGGRRHREKGREEESRICWPR